MGVGGAGVKMDGRCVQITRRGSISPIQITRKILLMNTSIFRGITVAGQHRTGFLLTEHLRGQHLFRLRHRQQVSGVVQDDVFLSNQRNSPFIALRQLSCPLTAIAQIKSVLSLVKQDVLG